MEAREHESDSQVVETGPKTQVVEFQLGADICAVDISEVDSIVEITKVTRVPRTAESIEGVMDLRGETTAILDLRTFLGIDSTTDDETQNVLVLDRADDKQKIGLRVDEVLEVVTYAESQIDESDSLENLNTRGIEKRAAKGIIRKPVGDDLDLVIWVDIDKIIEELK